MHFLISNLIPTTSRMSGVGSFRSSRPHRRRSVPLKTGRLMPHRKGLRRRPSAHLWEPVRHCFVVGMLQRPFGCRCPGSSESTGSNEKRTARTTGSPLHRPQGILAESWPVQIRKGPNSSVQERQSCVRSRTSCQTYSTRLRRSSTEHPMRVAQPRR